METVADLQAYIPSADDSDDEVAQSVVPHHHQPQPLYATSTASSDNIDLPPRKRLRMTEEDVQKRKRADTPPQRDPEYYLSDGSCVLLVDNVLFNVSIRSCIRERKPHASHGCRSTLL